MPRTLGEGCSARPSRFRLAPWVPASPSPTELSARDELQAAFGLFRTTTYSYAQKGDYPEKQKIRATGSRDPQAQELTRTVTITGGPDATSGRLLLIGGDGHRTKAGTTHWQHVDPKSRSAVIDTKDPDGLTRFAAGIITTRRTAPHKFVGDVIITTDPGQTAFLPQGAPSLTFSGYHIMVA